MQGGLRQTLLIWVLLFGLFAARRAEAVNPETLLMPGKVTTAHAKWEEQCSQCHDRTDWSHRCHSTTTWKGARVQ